MQAFVEYVVKGLVDEPEEVSVSPVEKNDHTVYELRMNPKDIGRVVGRKGNTINAIRTLLTSGASKKGLRCSLEIIEDETSSDNE